MIVLNSPECMTLFVLESFSSLWDRHELGRSIVWRLYNTCLIILRHKIFFPPNINDFCFLRWILAREDLWDQHSCVTVKQSFRQKCECSGTRHSVPEIGLMGYSYLDCGKSFYFKYIKSLSSIQLFLISIDQKHFCVITNQRNSTLKTSHETKLLLKHIF